MRNKDPLQDLKDFLELMNKNHVRFTIVGAHAMTHWGYTRATGDLDLLVVPDKSNSQRVIRTLQEFGAPMNNLNPSDFDRPGQVLQIGVPPLRIDVLTSLTGVSSTAVFRSSKKGTLLGIPVRFMELKTLIRNKKALGRPKDLLDVLELEALKAGKHK